MIASHLLTVVGGRVAAAGPPLTPDAPTARRWAVEELANPEYHRQESILQRILDWVQDRLAGIQDAAVLPLPAIAAILVGAAVVALLIAWWIAGPVRVGRARALTGAVLDDDDVRTAEQLRAAADAAAARGEWAAAVVERFRSVVRDLEERAVLDERPGRTAHEATLAAAVVLGDVADELVAGGRLFDDVAYGGRDAARADDDAMRALAARVAAARRTPRTLITAAVPR